MATINKTEQTEQVETKTVRVNDIEVAFLNAVRELQGDEGDSTPVKVSDVSAKYVKNVAGDGFESFSRAWRGCQRKELIGTRLAIEEKETFAWLTQTGIDALANVKEKGDLTAWYAGITAKYGGLKTTAERATDVQVAEAFAEIQMAKVKHWELWQTQHPLSNTVVNRMNELQLELKKRLDRVDALKAKAEKEAAEAVKA